MALSIMLYRSFQQRTFELLEAVGAVQRAGWERSDPVRC
jgi:hypothetical protein